MNSIVLSLFYLYDEMQIYYVHHIHGKLLAFPNYIIVSIHVVVEREKENTLIHKKYMFKFEEKLFTIFSCV